MSESTPSSPNRFVVLYLPVPCPPHYGQRKPLPPVTCFLHLFHQMEVDSDGQ